MSRRNSNVSQLRQNYSVEAEAAVNRQINLELYMSYVYLSLQGYFGRDDVALAGFAKCFERDSDDSRARARKLMKYQNLRGGRIVFADIKKAEKDEWGTGIEALQAVFELQKSVNTALLELHAIAAKNNDPQMADFLESDFLELQAKELKTVADALANLKRVGPGLGEYQYDKFSLNQDERVEN